MIEHLSTIRFNELSDTVLQEQSKFIKVTPDRSEPYPTMVTNFITPDGDDDMNISYVNSNKTASLPVELGTPNNKGISCAKDFPYAEDFFLYVGTQLKIVRGFCRPGKGIPSSTAGKVLRAFIDLANKARGKKDFMYICTFCCFAERAKGDYSHYRTFLFDIGNQCKIKFTQSEKKELFLTLEFNDTIIESQEVTGNKAKHILEDIERFYRNEPDTHY